MVIKISEKEPIHLKVGYVWLGGIEADFLGGICKDIKYDFGLDTLNKVLNKI